MTPRLNPVARNFNFENILNLFNKRLKLTFYLIILVNCNCASYLAYRMVDPINNGEVHKIELKNKDIFYYTVGNLENPPMIFLHGILAFTEAYSDFIESLSQKYYIVGVDLRGHGRSSIDSSSFTLEDISNDVLIVADRLSIDNFYIVGHSAGGFLALQLSKNYPDRVIKTVTIASLYNFEGIDFQEKNDYLTKNGFQYNSDFSTNYIVNIFDSAYKMMGEKEKFDITKSVMRDFGEALYPSFSDVDLKKITTPVFVIVAGKDKRIKPEHTIKMEKLIPNSELLVVKSAHHFEIATRKKIRLYGINAPETRTLLEKEKAAGILAKDRLEELLGASNGEFELISHGWGKFGRCLGEIFINGQSINEQLIKEGLVERYEE